MHTAVVSHLVLLVPVRDGNDECFWCVCVLTGLWNKKYDRIMRWWGSKPQSGIDEVLDSAAYCYVLLPRLPCYSSTSCSYQTSSSTHLGFPCLQPSIYAYQTKSFTHLGISRIRTIILTSQPSLPPPVGSYCVALFPNILLLFASREIPAKVARICFYVASWRHQACLLPPPPSQSLSLAQNSNSGRNATHCATVACRLLI